jgi:putative transposase
MPTTTKIPSRTQSAIVLDCEEFDPLGLESGARSAGAERSEPDERAERAGGRAQRGAGGTRRAEATGSCERGLRPELVEEAIGQARLRRAVGELDETQRAQLVGGLLEELVDDGVELGEEFNEQLLDAMLGAMIAGKRSEREILGSGGVLGELTRRLVERALREELSEHLGYPAGQAPPGGAGNSRNGGTPKTLLTDSGRVRIDTPRDRKSRFEPQLVKKGQRRLAGLDEKIIALYAGGMSTREIEAYISELYGPGVSRETVSRVTAAVLEDAKAWQTRPLEQVYPILYLDALVIKIRDGQAIRNFACYLAIGVNLEGDRDVLGMWFQRTEGAKFWLQVLTELKTRGVQDVLVCCVDGLTGFPEAIEAVYPQAWVQTCVVHAIRAALRFVPYRDKRKVAQDLKKIYTAVDRDHAERELERFAETWDAKYPMISASWIENWERIVPFLAFPPDVRRAVYTTDESVKRLRGRIGPISGDGSVAGSARRPGERLLSRCSGDRRLCGPDFWACGGVAARRRRLPAGLSVRATLPRGRGQPRSEAQVLGLMPAAQLAPQRAHSVASHWRRPRPSWAWAPAPASRRPAGGRCARPARQARVRVGGLP